MCRLMGISYGKVRESLDTAEIAAILFPALVGQGPHAYGWMTQNDDYGIHYEKHTGRCDTDEAWERIIETVDPGANWFVGHTRWATHGSPQNPLNNHPVPHGNIVGCHNGVLRNHSEILAVTGRETEGTEVDSEAIFAAVNKWGPQKGLRKVKGDMVAIWGDRRKERKLFIARSMGRQLTLGWTVKGNLIFASERRALEKLRPEIQFRHFSTISENKLLEIKDGDIVNRVRFAPLPKKIYTRALREPGQTTMRTPHGPVRVRSIVEHFDNEPSDIAADRIRNAAREAVAQRRGSLLFPNRDREKEPSHVKLGESVILERRTRPQTDHAKKWLQHASNGTLVDWNGVLVTPDEYEWMTGEPAPGHESTAVSNEN